MSEQETNRSHRIFVAEDEENIRKLVQFQLLKNDYDVRASQDGREAIEKIKEFQPHLVVLDMMMPGKTGDQIAESIRNTPDLKDTKIVVMTAIGQGTQGSMEQIKNQVDADFVIEKPFEMDHFLEKVEQLLGEIET